ncbi:MAG: hypothetical protein A3J66_00610 [Candidatus Magasanikbacteria bacterium RIFCSPHIGHO2_02_FULL_47_14]|uniref:histidine kinase n=1 Tax=Candidatus Magasanikbacteria bacterium RIFCSPHIGHO2_02_FULL_47_14 TaxID=1798680 RepID=A0A1F6MAL5_9BACT|nr:MAG: hypothetical protein A3J66_00610 [Candidatus Magasanikbacteria bacterium RIFCSPHIGHO2_02_FULL_47_14]
MIFFSAKNAVLNDVAKILDNKIQFLLDSIGDGIFLVDAKGTIRIVNSAATELLGISAEKLIGEFCLKPFGALNDKGVVITKKNAALMEAITDGKKTVNAIRQFKKHTGALFWSSITVTPIRDRNKTKGAIIVFRDITEEKKEEEYHADFARVASHQLRTPLGNVQWALEYVLTEKEGKLNKTHKEYLQQAYKTLHEMNTLINDLLNVSRLQNQHIREDVEHTAVEEILDKVIADLQHFATANNVRFDIDLDTDKMHDVKVDKHHLRTIVQNLIENAIRYANPHTAIRLVIKRQGQDVLFSCANEGIGIPKQSQQFIFAKFFRAKNAIKKQGDGTGLGLYITHELVRLYDGKIWFESIPNKTTTFSILFKA